MTDDSCNNDERIAAAQRDRVAEFLEDDEDMDVTFRSNERK